MLISDWQERCHATTADLHPMGTAEIWPGNQISASITVRIPIITDEDGCPAEEQPFPPTTKILQKLVPLWEHSIYEWAQIINPGRPPLLPR